jgi:hypothetical protein
MIFITHLDFSPYSGSVHPSSFDVLGLLGLNTLKLKILLVSSFTVQRDRLARKYANWAKDSP